MEKLHRKLFVIKRLKRLLDVIAEEGKCRAIGVSNYEVRHLEELLQSATVLPAVNQCEYHPHFYETDLVNFCASNDVQFQVSRLLVHQPDFTRLGIQQFRRRVGEAIATDRPASTFRSRKEGMLSAPVPTGLESEPRPQCSATQSTAGTCAGKLRGVEDNPVAGRNRGSQTKSDAKVLLGSEDCRLRTCFIPQITRRAVYHCGSFSSSARSCTRCTGYSSRIPGCSFPETATR